jgi:hypothetical protein
MKDIAVSRPKLESMKEITVNGLPGLEALSSCVATDGGKEFFRYSVVLFQPDGRYFFMDGTVDAARREEFEPQFRLLANSFRLP